MASWLGRFLPEGGIGRKVVTVASGAVAGQAITVLASPFLTRIYSPGDFGLLGFYLSVIGITSTVSTLCFEKAIPIASTDEDARSLLVVSLFAVLSVTVFVVCMGFLLPKAPTRFSIINHLRPYFFLWPIGLLGLGFQQALSVWGIRQRAYRVLAKAKFAQGSGSAIFQTGFGLLKGGPLSLISGDALGRLLGSVSLLALGRADRDLRSAPRFWRHHLRTMREYRRFPIFGLGSSFLNTAGAQGTIFMVALLFDPWQTGLFVFANRMINIPIALVGKAASQVFIGEISQVIRERPEAFHGIYRLTLHKLNKVGAILAILLLVFPPLVVAPIFGGRWKDAGLIMAILAPAAWVQFVAFPVSESPVLLGRLDLQLIWDAGRLLAISLALWLPRRLGAGFLPVVAWYSATVTVAYVVLLILIARVTPKPVSVAE